MSLKVVLAVLIFLNASLAESACYGEQCTYDLQGNLVPKSDLETAVRLTDQQLKRVYWFYLRGAQRVFQGNIDTTQKFIHFFIYRNKLGTFLGIGYWNHLTQKSELSTFIRLGNGFSEQTKNLYEPVNIDPLVISLKIKHGQNLIQIDQNGKIVCQNPQGCSTTPILIPRELTRQKIAISDRYLRENYSNYLKNAAIVHEEFIRTNASIYALFTYVNVVGTFITISSIDVRDIVQVNTFVRLGTGSINPQQIVSTDLQGIQVVQAA